MRNSLHRQSKDDDRSEDGLWREHVDVQNLKESIGRNGMRCGLGTVKVLLNGLKEENDTSAGRS